MKKRELIEGLNGLAEELRPFTIELSPGQRIWNGTTWALNDKTRHADRYSMAWLASLTTAAELLDAQESPLSVQQIELLKKKLFGGAGSLNDFHIDEKAYGEEAKIANANLMSKTSALFRLFDQSI